MKYTNEQIMNAVLAEMKDREHAEHSPSSLKFKALCGGFRQDPTGDKTAADRGTLGHKAVELENTDFLPEEDEELIEAVNNCIYYLNELRSKYGAPPGSKKEFVIEPSVIFENKTPEFLLGQKEETNQPKREEYDQLELTNANPETCFNGPNTHSLEETEIF